MGIDFQARGKGVEATFITYTDFGPHGARSFRGVTNSFLVNDVIDTYNAKSVFDPMAGSGTVQRLCDEKGIPCFSVDIKPQLGYACTVGDITNPKVQRDATAEIRTMTDSKGVDLIWFDPPYFDMVAYSDIAGDLSYKLPYSTFLVKAREMLRWLGTLLSDRGLIAFECGDLVRPGRMFPITDDVLDGTRLGTNTNLQIYRRLINGFNLHVRDGDGYRNYLQAIKWQPDERTVEINHEYITLLRRHPGYADLDRW